MQENRIQNHIECDAGKLHVTFSCMGMRRRVKTLNYRHKYHCTVCTPQPVWVLATTYSNFVTDQSSSFSQKSKPPIRSRHHSKYCHSANQKPAGRAGGGSCVTAVVVAGEDAARQLSLLELEAAALRVHVLQHAYPYH